MFVIQMWNNMNILDRHHLFTKHWECGTVKLKEEELGIPVPKIILCNYWQYVFIVILVPIYMYTHVCSFC